MAREERIYGPPGTGKTTRLKTRVIPEAIEKYGRDNVMVSSFTRAAAKVLIDLNLDVPDEMVGTLHSICFHGLGRPELAQKHIKKWNEQWPAFAIKGVSTGSMDDGADEEISGAVKSEGDELYSKMQYLRAKMVPVEKWPGRIQRFKDRWDNFKENHNCLDFDDLIEKCLDEMPMAPNHPAAIILDEAQDFTPIQLKLVRQWGLSADKLLLVGDDDQCQPAGEMILTPNGEKPIEDLDPEKDFICEYSKNDNRIFGMKSNLYRFKKAVREYSGDIFTIHCDQKKARCAGNHLWLTKWDKEKAKKANVVYLMRKGENFRIGWCQLMRADGCLHIGARSHNEGADSAWILKVCEDKADASIWESFYATKYGISTAPFRGHNNNIYYTDDKLSDLFKMIGNHTDQLERANNLLFDLHLSISYPFWTQFEARTRRGGSSINKTRAVNILPGYMNIPSQVRKSSITKWRNIDRIEIETVCNIKVFSLDTEKHHTYITNGLVTHNCIYSFMAADPDAFINPPVPDDRKTVLSQSYRVPKKVHDIAMRMILRVKNRVSKDYRPRTEAFDIEVEGDLIRLNDNAGNMEKAVDLGESYAAQGKSVMFLTSCSYMLNPLKNILKRRGIPFWNKYRKRRPDWNPLMPSSGVSSADLVLNFIGAGEDGPYWTVQQFITWAKFIGVSDSGLIRKAGNKALKILAQGVEDGAEGLHTTREVLAQVLSPDAVQPALDRNLDWFQENLKKSRSIAYVRKVMDRCGKDALTENPRFSIGTVHSVKGGEADVVILAPDLSAAGFNEYMGPSATRDPIIRLFYVGMTRARETLVLLDPPPVRYPKAVEWP